MTDFNREIAVVTGSSAGIGFSTARLLLSRGAIVVINGRSQTRLDEAFANLQPLGGERLMAVAGDITDEKFRKTLIHEVLSKFAKIDILVNNAGGGTPERHAELLSDSDWQQVLDVNLSAAFALCRGIIPLMKENRYGRIVNVSSLAGRFKGRLSGPHYAAAKAGMLGLTRHLAYDLGSFGITVNAVAPGFIHTERTDSRWKSLPESVFDETVKTIPAGRFGNPDEVAEAIAFLASRQASYITGHTLDVNGGCYMV